MFVLSLDCHNTPWAAKEVIWQLNVGRIFLIRYVNLQIFLICNLKTLMSWVMSNNVVADYNYTGRGKISAHLQCKPSANFIVLVIACCSVIQMPGPITALSVVCGGIRTFSLIYWVQSMMHWSIWYRVSYWLNLKLKLRNTPYSTFEPSHIEF